MLFKNGELVQYGKYIGRIFHTYPDNKTYEVELYNYKKFPVIYKQIDQKDLCEFTQIQIAL